MKTEYHIEITRKALKDNFSEAALEIIIKANIKQDNLRNTFGHDYIHFDGSAFEEGFQYISEQEKLVSEFLEAENYEQAQMAFGRITHSWQDFYSHSNYVRIWSINNPKQSPKDIIVNDRSIFDYSNFSSGKNYGIIEFFSMVQLFSWFILPFMPADSHAKMNLDSPSSGPLFDFAYWAALYATQAAYESLISKLLSYGINLDIITVFTGKNKAKV